MLTSLRTCSTIRIGEMSLSHGRMMVHLFLEIQMGILQTTLWNKRLVLKENMASLTSLVRCKMG